MCASEDFEFERSLDSANLLKISHLVSFCSSALMIMYHVVRCACVRREREGECIHCLQIDWLCVTSEDFEFEWRGVWIQANLLKIAMFLSAL